MRGMWAVCKREWSSYFVTPMGYVILGAYGIITGSAFTISFLGYCERSQNPGFYALPGVPDFEETFLSPYILFCGFLVLFIGPLVTMRLMAEERRRGTAELLLTYPLRDRDIVFGKYLATLGLLLTMVMVVAVNLVFAARFSAVEPAVLALGLLSVFLMGAAFFSLGLFISALTSNQMTAGMVTFGAWFGSHILGSLARDLPASLATLGDLDTPLKRLASGVYGLFRAVAQEIPLDPHAEELAQGALAPVHIVYYIVFSAFFLFLTFRVLSSRKWRA